MPRPIEILLRLDSIDQLIDPSPRSPFVATRLRPEADAFIVERTRALALPKDRGIEFVITLTEDQSVKSRDVEVAIHEHFDARREQAERELGRVRHFGWRSFLIGLLFLGLTLVLVQLVDRLLPAGNFSSLLRNGLIILAWVALWRPGELLLYEWYPHRRDARLFRRLARATVRVEVYRVR
jgi:hypothetical protein